MEHYYTKNTTTQSNKKDIIYYIKDKELKFTSDNGVFSKSGIDFGSNLLITTFLDKVKDEKKSLLDVGCGYGVMGLTINYFKPLLNITMVDINERAISLTKENSKSLNLSANIFYSDALSNVEGTFDYIITNPPIRTGKTVIYKIYEESYNHLNDKGELYIVIQKKQGAQSTQAKLIELFGNCETINKKSGYQILRCIKNK
ncbi:MAG: class I SAM-dependent methyltransferase [Lachnospirales bacterium]